MPPIFAFYRMLDIIADVSVKVNTFEKIVGKRSIILFGKNKAFRARSENAPRGVAVVGKMPFTSDICAYLPPARKIKYRKIEAFLHLFTFC
jgi:hypothetical protein